jgi:UDP-N-acetylglucosamine 4,6-dehydratase (inverting)
MQKIFKDKTVLITGGTGSFGSFAVNMLLKVKNIKKIIIFSRDELKQTELVKKFSATQQKKLRFFIGDVRDLGRLEMACRNVDYIIHAAALKHVPVAEYNPFECIKTNIMGSQNVIEAALKNNVKNVIALSTDKACSPINLYGATKLCAEKLFVAANQMVGDLNVKFSVVRYGNVMGSRGSVLPFFLQTSIKNYFPITDLNMTRFNISLIDAFNLVVWALKNNKGGEIFIPKLSSFKVLDLAKAINNKAKIEVIGIREGEKIHEELVSYSEINNLLDLGKNYAIILGNKKKKHLLNKKILTSYNSGTTANKLSIMDLKKIVEKNYQT